MGTPRLASLTLEGFKSFAARVELAFPAAITAIVGPNGSGKSNICDAIAWVLGEQSARLLRSQTMSDVVFAGSPSRDAAGAASVTLGLAADDGRWREGDGRLTVSRRVLRDGSSEYRMGGRRTRLKDVLEQLADAGMGTRAYAIIEQGRIGQVLSVRSTERRALFEEAAGVTKYRMRRHEAELRLTETRANLARVADIANEVRRQLEAARRQARRAERHRELRQELGETRALVFAFRRDALAVTAASRRAELETLQSAEAEAAARLAAADAEHETRRRDLDLAQDALAAARAGAAAVDAEAARREAEEEAARREQEDARQRGEQAEAAGTGLAKELEERTVEEAELDARATAAAAAASEEAGVAAEAAAVADRAQAAAREAAQAAEDARRALLAATSSFSEARNKTHRLQVEIDQNRYQHHRLVAEHERLGAHLAEAREREAAAAATETTAREHGEQADRQRRELRSRHETLSARATDLAAERDRAAHERWQARHDREGAERLLASARTLPQAIARAVPDDQLLGTVADFLDPEPEVAAALERAYGELLTLPVVAGPGPLAALRGAAEKAGGRLEVVVADAGPARPSPLLERAGAAAADLRWLSRALPRAATADDDATAAGLAAGDPDLLVVASDGTVRRGLRVELPGSRGSAPGVLQLRHRARDAARRETEAASHEETTATDLHQVQQELAALAGRLADADAAAQAATEALAAATSTRAALQREVGRYQRELEAVASELTRLEKERSGLEAAREAASQEADRLAARSAAAEQDVDRLVRVADRAREAAAGAAAEAERRRGAAAVAAERGGAAAREVERHRAGLADLRQRMEAAHRDVDTQRQRAEAALRRAVELRETLAGLLTRSAELHRDEEKRSAGVAELRQRVAQGDQALEGLRSAHLAARDAAHAGRLALAEAESAVQRLAESVALTLGPDAELPASPPPAARIGELEARERDLQHEMELLGPVNELAVAERDQLEERNTFLKGQRRDLERSLDSLTGTIAELDATCSERFLATIEEVNGTFPLVFRELFGGGDASVELSDPENPLETGVEIRVRPPGKHTQSVLLLSGGEKALSAVALLLSLFRIRPAPFCVLDEVDAPLDDANVERFCRLLREMSSDTQFLLITHNRRTMAHADVLYGVTMEEPGVSRIVSVRMED